MHALQRSLKVARNLLIDVRLGGLYGLANDSSHGYERKTAPTDYRAQSTITPRNAFMAASLVGVLHDSTARRRPIDSHHDRAR